MGRALPALVVILGGCLTEDNVAARYADTWCEQVRRCDRGQFDRAWGEMDDCRDDAEDAFEVVIDLWDAFGCDLELDAARQTLRALDRASCEEFVEGDWGSEESAFVCE